MGNSGRVLFVCVACYQEAIVVAVDHIDYIGISALIAATGAFISGTVFPIMIFIRQGRNAKIQAANGEKLDVVHKLVNGNNDRMVAAVTKIAAETGVQINMEKKTGTLLPVVKPRR